MYNCTEMQLQRWGFAGLCEIEAIPHLHVAALMVTPTVFANMPRDLYAACYGLYCLLSLSTFCFWK